MALRTKLLDLDAVNATNFMLETTCVVNDAIRAALESLSPGKFGDQTTVVFGAAHGKGASRTVDLAILEISEKGQPHLHARIMYGLTDGPVPPKEVPKPGKLFEILAMSETKLDFVCHVLFRYEQGAARSAIQLPIRVFATDKAGFNQIAGIKLSRAEPKDSGYSIDIDIDDEKTLTHYVTLKYKCQAGPSVAQLCLKEAVAVSKAFLV
jgi:hypothetical protein